MIHKGKSWWGLRTSFRRRYKTTSGGGLIEPDATKSEVTIRKEAALALGERPKHPQRRRQFFVSISENR